MIRLPEEYQKQMRAMLGAEEAASFFASLDSAPCHGIRLNPKKGTVPELENLLVRSGLFEAAGMKKIPWIPNGFEVGDVQRVSAHPYYRAGLYYIQEPSAMTPAASLPVDPADRVLDLCAAPGGKATQLGACLSDEGFLLANDISASRAKALVKNLEMAGIPNCCVTAENPERLAEVYPSFFDKILLDAPCSGEGMFRRDPGAVQSWIRKGPAFYAPVQESLLESAAAMLSPGGLLVYSTCTFSETENEQQILTLLKRHPELSIRQIPFFGGFARGRCGLSEAVRIYPHRMRGEGHFVCLIEKKKEEEQRFGKEQACRHCSKPAHDTREFSGAALPEEVKRFLDRTGLPVKESRYFREQERIYLLYPGTDRKNGLRYLRTGLLLGTCRKDRFEPSQALAMSLGKDLYSDCLSLESTDPLVEKYLRGESVPDFRSGRTGNVWLLLLADGYPLGWMKASGTMLKNKYEPSWRKL